MLSSYRTHCSNAEILIQLITITIQIQQENRKIEKN